MFEVNEEKSRASHELITKAFEKQIQDPTPYVVVYGYFVKTGILSKKVSSYVVGFSEALKEIIIIQTDADIDNAAEAITLKKEDVISAKFGLQGELKLKSGKLDKELKFIVPPFTPAITEGAYILPITQKEAAVAFKSFIKDNF
jgi:hypothetical protein